MRLIVLTDADGLRLWWPVFERLRGPDMLGVSADGLEVAKMCFLNGYARVESMTVQEFASEVLMLGRKEAGDG